MLFPTSYVSAQRGQPPVTDLAPSNIPGTSDQNGLVKCGNSDDTGTRAQSGECTFNDFINLIQNIFNLVFAFAGFIAAGLFMYAGFLMLTAMGNAAQITQAKAVFRRVAVGFLVLFMSFIFIQQTLKYMSLSPKAKAIIERFIDIPNS